MYAVYSKIVAYESPVRSPSFKGKQDSEMPVPWREELRA